MISRRSAQMCHAGAKMRMYLARCAPLGCSARSSLKLATMATSASQSVSAPIHGIASLPRAHRTRRQSGVSGVLRTQEVEKQFEAARLALFVARLVQAAFVEPLQR